MSPWELRLKNANRIGDTTANRVAMQDPSTVPVTLAAAERVGEQLGARVPLDDPGAAHAASCCPSTWSPSRRPRACTCSANGGGRS